jgi:monovalent cation:H+ antiporter-2, CPA2 family
VASTINIGNYDDALVVLGTAGIVVPLVRRFGFSPVLGYLGAGALLGPLGLGSFQTKFPALFWFTIGDAKNVEGIADLGVVFLLFLIGLELSLQRLLAMRRLVFGLGGLQVLITGAILAGIAVWSGRTPAIAAMLGLSLSLSSTAIVLELLSNQERLTTSVGRASFSVLLAQDLAVVPILMFVSLLGADSGGSVLGSLGRALLQAAVAIAVIVLFGRVLRPLFRLVTNTRSTELFIAAVLFVIIAAGVVAYQAGLSMALGAFVAGLLLAETEYRKAIEATVEPFKGLLLGIFFFTVGMEIDFRELVHEPVALAVDVVGLIAIKSLVLIGLARLFHLSWPVAIEMGLLLGPGGEFAFVSISMATGMNLIEPELASFTLAVTSVTMVLIPVLSFVGRRFAARLRARAGGPVASELSAAPTAPEQRHAIVVGYGRVGKVVCALLKEHNVPYIAADSDSAIVTHDRRDGHDVYYGDATDPNFLEVCGLSRAAGVIVTIHTHDLIDDIVEHVRAARPDIMIVARARDAVHASHLYALGATDAVPETIEASLQLSEAALVELGVPTGPVIASIHEKRDEIRHALQEAARQAGRDTTIRSVRAKTRRPRKTPRKTRSTPVG